MKTFAQNESVVFYGSFVDYKGEAATITGTPTITIKNYYGGITTFVNAQNMTQLAGSTYYYTYHIPARADETVYSVLYSATYETGETVVGEENFHVVTRNFFKRKGGGFVQRIAKSDVWTQKEKDALLDAIDKLLKDGKVRREMFENKFLTLSSLVSEISKDLEAKLDKSSTVMLDEQAKCILTLTDQLRQEIEKQKAKMETYGAEIKKLSEKGEYDDVAVVKKLTLLSNSIASLNDNIRKERFGLIISELDDLKKDLDELKETFVLTIPTEILKRLKDGHEDTDRKRV